MGKTSKVGQSIDFELLESILRVQSETYKEDYMTNFITRKLDEYEVHYVVDDMDNIIASTRVGHEEYVPCLCCHTDTVHKIQPSMTLKKKKVKGDIIYSSPTGVGGDDKCGIYITLETLRKYEGLDAVFFASEECGCQGSGQIDLSTFERSSCLIGIDRKGSSDLIMSYMGEDTASLKFLEVIEPAMHAFGFEYAEGMITDVMELAERGIGLSVINISSGFYKPHTKEEYISAKDLENSKSFIEAVIGMIPDEKFEHGFSLFSYRHSYSYDYSHTCSICHGEISIGDRKAFHSENFGTVCAECVEVALSHMFRGLER